MYNDSHILIGSKLNDVRGRVGKYAVQFMDATLTFDNGSNAVEAYENLKGEAYIWDMSNYKRVILLEAKLSKEYYSWKQTGGFAC